MATLRTALVALFLGVYTVGVGTPVLVYTAMVRSPRLLFAAARPAIRCALWLAAVRCRVHGLERLDPDRTYLFMPNHQSNVDPPIIFLAVGRDVRMIAKAALFRLPFIGAAMRLGGYVPVVREDRDKAIEAVKLAAEALRRGVDFVVFPEGTRSPDGKLLPLKKGPFFMAIESGVPVVPVVIRGTAGLLPKGSRRILSGDVDIEFCPPIEVGGEGLDDRRALRAQVRQALASRLEADGRRGDTELATDGPVGAHRSRDSE